MAKSSNFGGILITLIVLGGIGYGGYYFYNKGAQKDPEFSTLKAERRQIIQAITASGNLQTMRTVDIGAQVSGLVLDVTKDFNDIVSKDEILVIIDPTTYDQKLLQAQADFESFTASLSITEADTKRAHTLYDAKLISDVDLVNADAKLTQAKATLVSRKASLTDAQTNLSRTIVRSPIDGIVLSRLTDPGKTVNATNSVPNLMTLVPNLDKLQIDAGVSEADIGNVQEGQTVTFTVDAYPGSTFNATVDQVRNSSKNTGGVVTYSAIINVDNAARRLRPGMTANVSIIIASRAADTLVVPNSTLRVRIPPEIEKSVTKAGAAGAAPATASTGPKTLTPEEKLGLEQDILVQAGIMGGRGAAVPTPDALEKAKQLAKDKGLTDMTFIDNAARGGGRGARGAGGVAAGGRGAGGAGGGRGGAGRTGGPNINAGFGQNVSSVARTIYRLVTDANGKKHPESLSVTLGISDGQFTEVTVPNGLQEGEALLTYVTMPGAVSQIKTAPAGAAQSPFSTGNTGRGGGGIPGGGGGGGRGGG